MLLAVTGLYWGDLAFALWVFLVDALRDNGVPET
jgi:hypothetical protein